jgi:hypothetical protein
MKKGQVTEEQIVRVLLQAERGEQTIGVLCRKHASLRTPSTVSDRTLAGPALPRHRSCASWKKRMPG